MLLLVLLYILFWLSLFLAPVFFLARAAVRAFKRKEKRAGFVRLALTLCFLYAVFHYMTFEDQNIFPLAAWDAKWSYRVRNESSIENPKVLFEFKKMYVRYKIDPSEHNETDFSSEGYIYGKFYTKNIGYEFNRAIVPRGIKAEIVQNFDYMLEIVLKDDTE